MDQIPNGQGRRQTECVQIAVGQHDRRADDDPVLYRHNPGAVDQSKFESTKGVQGRLEPEPRGVRRFGEQTKELRRTNRQRNNGAKASGRHARLANRPAKRHPRRVRVVPRLLERPEPAEEAVHAVGHLRRDRQKHWALVVRAFFRRRIHDSDGFGPNTADSGHGTLGRHVHGHIFLHRRRQHGKNDIIDKNLTAKSISNRQ